MKQKIHYLFMLLLMLVTGVGGVKAETTTWVKTAAADLQTGDVVVIVDTYTYAYASIFALPNDGGTSKSPVATKIALNEDKSQIAAEAEVPTTLQWVVTANNGSYKFGVSDSENYLYCNDSNTGLRVGTNKNNAFEIKNNYLYNTAQKRYIGVYSSQDWRSYTSINDNIQHTAIAFYKKVESGSSAVATTLTIDDTGITNTDVYQGTAAGSLSATVKDASNNAVSDATVTWSGNNDNVATIDESTGAVTLVAAGTVTFTASYAGNNDYQASSATYELTVTDSTPFEGVIFKAAEDKDEKNTAQGSGSIVKDNVTFSCTSGILGNGSEYRMYKNSTVKIRTTDGSLITKIEFTGVSGNPASGFGNQTGWSTSGNNGIWTGEAESVSFEASGAQVRATEIKVTVAENTNPSIIANNVEILYDAKSGSISYSIENPVDGGVVTANKTADWLTIGTIAENSIPFSCTANSAGTARSATVTLTYTYNTNEIITKDVTVTQAADPNFAMTIAAVRAQGTGSVVTKGVVTSTYGKNAYIQDADAAIVVRTDGDLTCVVGDEIRVSGTLGDYNGLLQIQNANITNLTSGNPVTPEVMTIANVNNSTNQGWLVKIVDATVTAISDKNVTIEQGENSIEVRFNNATDITFAVNDILTLTGNIGHYSGSNQIANPTDVEKKVLTPVTLTFTDVPETITKGETTICKVTAEPSVEGITYSSSDENIVQVGSETGEITAMGIGTATITANYAGDSDHSSATASYTIQVIGAPHTATFYVNGDKLSELTVNEGSDIEFPVVKEQEINGKKFVGWTTSEITEPTNTKPTLVTSATMGTVEMNYYAVYVSVEGEEFTATLSSDEIIANFTKDKMMAYGTAVTFVDGNLTWVANAYTDQPDRPWFQIKKESADAYLKIASDLNISEIKLTITSANNSSGGITDITKHTVFEGKVYLESEASGSPEGTLGLSDVISNNSVTLVPNSSVNEIYIQPSAAARIWGAEVTCGNATYSGYCTTVKEQATIRLYLPNNPEGNLTEHQLSCSSAVILNVDTNSPGAITIQDMTDGITVIPNTDNKTVTLLASTNNGKVFSQPGEYTFRVVVGETDSYTSASVDFKLKVVKFKSYFNNLTGFEETKDLANGTNGGQLKDQLISNTQWGDASLKTWTSTNEDVATIDNDGNITLISTGQVRFIHSYTGNDYNEPCKISTGVMTVIDTTPTVLPTAPIIFHDSGDGVEYENALTVAIAGEGTIMYKLGADGEATAYTAPITINATTTVTAWAEKDGAKSDEVSKTFTINKTEKPAINLNGYYSIQNNGNGNYVNVAGRKTVTFVDEAATATAAGTVIKVETENAQVKVLRSQGVDVPGYADKAMRYVPEIVKLVVNKLNNLGEGQLMGEAGLEALMNKFNDAFDEHLYLETVGENSYRIYGRTPSMQHVVDFYAENKANVDAKLPMLKDKINAAIDKVLEKTGGRGKSILVPFSLETVWQNMGGTLTKPVDEASTMKFYEEVLTSETNVWNFAYQTAMIYWGNLKDNDTFKKYIGKLGDYAKYIDKVENIRPNFKYYIVQKDNKLDIISEGNGELNADFTAWTLIPRTDFSVAFNEENVLNNKYYTTLYTDFAYTLPEGEGVKAYKVTKVSEAGVAVKVEMKGIIPAQTPVLLESESKENQTLILSTEDGTAPTDNLLAGADKLIKEYQIKTAQVKALFDMAKEILGENTYNNYVKEYEHLMLRYAGTVNNKYFFGLSQNDMKGMKNVRMLNLNDAGENLGFYSNWVSLEANKALIIDSNDPVKLMLKGDVNRDGIVSIADVTALVNIILGKATYPADADKYDFDAAHVNADEDITIADVTALVNIILGKTQN